PLLALHDKDHRGGARPAGLAAAGGQQMNRPDTGPGENAEDRIAHPIAATPAVLAHAPGSAVPGWVRLSGETGLIVGPALATVPVMIPSGVRHGQLLGVHAHRDRARQAQRRHRSNNTVPPRTLASHGPPGEPP